MSTLSAAELQRRHELEGAPDPFPSLSGQPVEAPVVATTSRPNGRSELDTGSESAFPSLAPGPMLKTTAPASAWSAGPRVQSPTLTPRASALQTLTLSTIDLSHLNTKGKPPTLFEYQKTVGSKFRVQVTSVQQRSSGQTTFTIKGDSEKDIIKARKHLSNSLSPTVSVTVDAPNSTLPSIIGPGGATIKAIRDKTTARIDVPRRLEANNGEQGVTGTDSGDDEPSTTITITAPKPSALEAQSLILDVIAAKKSKSTQRIRGIPAHILPFVLSKRSEYLSAASGLGEVNLSLERSTNTITTSGDRDAVKAAFEKLSSSVETLRTSLTPLKMGLPKKQHRLLTSAAIDDIMSKTRCSVTVPAPEDNSDEITVWGNITQGTDISSGLQAVIAKVNSQHTQEFLLPSNSAESILLYIKKTGYVKRLQEQYPTVTVYLPSQAQVASGQAVAIDLVGEKTSIVDVVDTLSQLLAHFTIGIKLVPIDHLLHRLVQNKLGKKLKQIQDANHVLILFPEDKEESSQLLLVYDPEASSDATAIVKGLEAVSQELLKAAGECGELKSQTIEIDQKWHEAIRGKDGTTLNALIGDDRTLSIKLGAVARTSKANGNTIENQVLVRGATSDVDRAIKEIYKIVESAKNDEIDNHYSTEFEISREYVGRIVGTGGAAVNRMRDQLGVKVDFVDDTEDKDKDSNKKKKGAPASSVAKEAVKISGRKENVEEAKRRILIQVDRLADETSEVLKIPQQYHSSLIGTSGKYVIRLEERYIVKITFPRDTGEGDKPTRESLKQDEVLIKGGKKGVAEAKRELLDAVEFEKESNNTLQFTVPTRAVARILGRGGASINEIKDSSGAQIDVDKGPNEQTKVSLRGTKAAIAEAQSAILAIVNQVSEEVTETVVIESRHHRAIIGAGGQGLREIISRCGGPSDSKPQAGLVHFPRPGESADEIQLKGERKLVQRIKVELEKAAASLRDRIVIGVVIPAAQHKLLIGRGGQHLNDLQNRTAAQVQFPGSRAYASVGEPENGSELEGAAPEDLVKVLGPRSACEAAVNELKAKIRSSDTAGKPQNVNMLTAVVSVPLKYHHTILQQGNFARQLRSLGVQLEQPTASKVSSAIKSPPATPDARIDDEGIEVPLIGEVQWEVIQNYQNAEEGDADWILKAHDETRLEKGRRHLTEAIEHAKNASHVGILTTPNRRAFPRIVGVKGANVARLRAETGADITVSRDDNTITVIGEESAIEKAKGAILSIVNSARDRS